jgi:hypothetical protein
MRNPTRGSPAVRCVCGAATFTTRFDFVIKDPVAPPTHPFWLHFGEDARRFAAGRRAAMPKLAN